MGFKILLFINIRYRWNGVLAGEMRWKQCYNLMLAKWVVAKGAGKRS
jgi:hypothetical protein